MGKGDGKQAEISLLFCTKNIKEQDMKKIKKNRILAGALAFLISFSTIGNTASVLAAETDTETSVTAETSSEELKKRKHQCLMK